MAEDEKVVFEEALENLREAAQRIRAVFNRMRATSMLADPNHHDLAHRVASALAMTEAAGMEARRKLGVGASRVRVGWRGMIGALSAKTPWSVGCAASRLRYREDVQKR